MKKVFLILITIILLLGILGAGLGWYYFNYYQSAPSNEATLYPFTVSSGESVPEIAVRLENEGFIRHALMFRYIVKQNSLVLQAGAFELPKNLGVKDLATRLTLGVFDTQITLLEGWRREEIVQYLFESHLLPEISDRDKSELTIRNEVSQKIKEGYFYPDTYTLSQNTTLSELITIVNESFANQVDEAMMAKFNEQGLSLDQAVILASIVEREAKTDQSRKMVAGILLNRLRADWPLEADATVQYAMADETCINKTDCVWWSKEIYEADLQIDSPYNTRKYPGLPPEAICNPSLSSLSAVSQPTKSDYWFYLTGTDGKMYYAKTLEEHNQNIANHL